VYLRMGKSDRGDVHREMPAAQPGRLMPLKAGVQGGTAVIATGSMLRTALDVATVHLPDAAVWSAPFIKPFDVEQVAAICRNSREVFVVEEHSVLGGLGAAVCEIAAEHAPTRICRIGVADRYSEKCGSYEYLLTEHGLDAESVGRRMAAFMARV
jgi:transketolase